MSNMRHGRSFGLALAIVIVVVDGPHLSPQALAETPAKAAASRAAPFGQPCNVMSDPFKGRLGDPEPPPGLVPVDKIITNKILDPNAGLPCQESITSKDEKTGLENLQRGFDFYSWLTFIAMNSPAHGDSIANAKADTPTRWEDMTNFRQLLDVMLPPDKMLPPDHVPIWPLEEKKLEDEKRRLLPKACVPHYKPGMMIVKMIEETFNQPFKTGALIDQQGHYALFNILMNRSMFDYIVKNHLYSKAEQMAGPNSTLAIDFPAGKQPSTGEVNGDPGAIMLKVS
jgi:hypothetical protein